MNFEGKTGRTVHGCELKRGQEVHVRARGEELGIGIVDEVTGVGDGVWIFFPGAGPRRIPTDQGSIEFTVLESESGLRGAALVTPEELERH